MAFNAQNWLLATAKANECIKAFQAPADDQEAKLEKIKAPPPPVGSVSDEDKNKTLKLGLVNDVATCFWIKARASEEAGHKDDARKAYQSAAKYSYGRCWDPAGFYWSPAEDAVSRLRSL